MPYLLDNDIPDIIFKSCKTTIFRIFRICENFLSLLSNNQRRCTFTIRTKLHGIGENYFLIVKSGGDFNRLFSVELVLITTWADSKAFVPPCQIGKWIQTIVDGCCSCKK